MDVAKHKALNTYLSDIVKLANSFIFKYLILKTYIYNF